MTGAKRPGLSERSEAPGDRPGGPDDSPGASVSERSGLLRAKPASSGTSRPKLAGVKELATLVGDSGGCGGGGLGVEVAAAGHGRCERVVELVDQRHAGGDVEAGDGVV